MWTCKEGPPDVCLHIWWRRLILPYKVVVVLRCCCSIGSTPTQRASLLSLQDWCLPKKQLHARMMLMLSAVDNTLRASTYSTYEEGLKHENMMFVHTIEQDCKITTWSFEWFLLYLICLLFCCKPDKQSKNAKKTADGWKEAILFCLQWVKPAAVTAIVCLCKNLV